MMFRMISFASLRQQASHPTLDPASAPSARMAGQLYLPVRMPTCCVCARARHAALPEGVGRGDENGRTGGRAWCCGRGPRGSRRAVTLLLSLTRLRLVPSWAAFAMDTVYVTLCDVINIYIYIYIYNIMISSTSSSVAIK